MANGRTVIMWSSGLLSITWCTYCIYIAFKLLYTSVVSHREICNLLWTRVYFTGYFSVIIFSRTVNMCSLICKSLNIVIYPFTFRLTYGCLTYIWFLTIRLHHLLYEEKLSLHPVIWDGNLHTNPLKMDTDRYRSLSSPHLMVFCSLDFSRLQFSKSCIYSLCSKSFSRFRFIVFLKCRFHISTQVSRVALTSNLEHSLSVQQYIHSPQ